MEFFVTKTAEQKRVKEENDFLALSKIRLNIEQEGDVPNNISNMFLNLYYTINPKLQSLPKILGAPQTFAIQLQFIA